MSEVDETIRLAGRSSVIIRAGGNVNTFMYSDKTGQIIGKRKPDPYFDYELAAWFPSDSSIVEGDLVLQDSKYYLVMSVDKDYLDEDIQKYTCMLYECNSLVSIYEYNSVSKKYDSLIKDNVSCLITQVRAKEHIEDKSMVVKQYRGRRIPYQLFIRNNEGLTNTSIIVDQDNRRFRIGKQFDMLITSGIIQTEVLWENA